MNELATTQPAEMSVPAMMQAIIEKGITAESVSVMKELLTLKREMDADSARAHFNQDFIELRKECRPIAATRTIPTKDGGVKGRFASLEDIVGEVSPLLEKYGFSDTYSQSADGVRTKVTVTLLHRSGHERSSEYTCREHSSPQNSPAQNDGGTNKMARRHALCNMLGIVLDYSPDARLEGDTITAGEATDIRLRVAALHGNDDAWLRLADAKSWDEVRRAKYDVVIAAIEQEERKAAKPATPTDDRRRLADTVAKWSGVGADELGSAMSSVARAAGVVVSGKATPDQVAKTLTWVEANKHMDFAEAVAPRR